jgi:hypothetical protein
MPSERRSTAAVFILVMEIKPFMYFVDRNQ